MTISQENTQTTLTPSKLLLPHLIFRLLPTLTKAHLVAHQEKTLKSSQAATERVQNLRFEYWQQVKKIKPENLVFIDEEVRINQSLDPQRLQ